MVSLKSQILFELDSLKSEVLYVSTRTFVPFLQEEVEKEDDGERETDRLLNQTFHNLCTDCYTKPCMICVPTVKPNLS